MDRVQIYLIAWLCIDLLVLGYFIGSKDDSNITTNGQRAVYLVIGVATGMPWYGRVFGWW